jgi:hypothetical protein
MGIAYGVTKYEFGDVLMKLNLLSGQKNIL